MYTLHLAVNVFGFFPGRLLFWWSDSKVYTLGLPPRNFSKQNLELLTPLWQALLEMCCSADTHSCSATHHDGRIMSLSARLCSHLLGEAQDGVAQRVQGARGLAVGGTTPDTHGRPHGLRPQGRPSPQEESLRGTALLGAAARHKESYPEDRIVFVRISRDSCIQLLLSGCIS